MYIMKRFLGDEFERFNTIINKYNKDVIKYNDLFAY